MDEELGRVNPNSFFDQVTEARETAQAAQKTSNSNLTLLNELREKVEIISNDLKFLKDEAKDRAFEEEDRKQKEEMEAKVKKQNEKTQGGVVGDKGGTKDPEKKGLLGQVGSFLSNFVGGIVGGAVGFTLSGIGGMIGFGTNMLSKAKDIGEGIRKRLFGKKKDKKVKTDSLMNTKIDDGDDEKKETEKNIFDRVLGGMKNMISNFDERPGSRKTKKKLKLYNDYIKEGAEIMEIGGGDFHITYKDGNTTTLTSVGMGGEGDTLEERFNDHIKQKDKFRKEQAERFKEADEKFDSKKKKKNIFGFNQGGEVDSVPAMLTPGEFVVTKDAVEKVGVDTLKGLNASVGATNKASNLGSFSIQRLDPSNLSKDALVKKSSFANNIKDVEISNESGSDYFRSTTDMSTGGLSSKTVQRRNFTEVSEDGTVTVFSQDEVHTEQTSSIGVPDLIEHQDQLLGEIHKLKGFESVTIDQVINETTGIPQEKLLPILLKSDAQKATDEKQDRAMEEDRKARGIKPGQGFSMSADDEVAKSLQGTMGYRIGQINPDQLVSSKETFTDKTKVVSKTGVEPKTDSSFADLSASINASVKGYNQGGLVGSSITPIIESKNESGEMELIQNLSQSVESNNQNINVIQAQNTAMNPPNNNPQTTVPAEPSNTTLTGLQDTEAPIPFAMLLRQNAQRYLNLGNDAMVIS